MGDLCDSIQQLSTTSTEFKRALKVLIKYEINCLLERLSDTGEEAIVITTSLEDGVQGHLGTIKGEGFLRSTESVKTLKEQFMQFCTDSGLTDDGIDYTSHDVPVDFSNKFDQVLGRSDISTHQAPSNSHLAVAKCGRDTEDPCDSLDSLSSKEDVGHKPDLHGHCLVTRDSQAEKKNIESTFFQEGDQGMICKTEEVRKIFEKGDDKQTLLDESTEGTGTVPDENGVPELVRNSRVKSDDDKNEEAKDKRTDAITDSTYSAEERHGNKTNGDRDLTQGAIYSASSNRFVVGDMRNKVSDNTPDTSDNRHIASDNRHIASDSRHIARDNRHITSDNRNKMIDNRPEGMENRFITSDNTGHNRHVTDDHRYKGSDFLTVDDTAPPVEKSRKIESETSNSRSVPHSKSPSLGTKGLSRHQFKDPNFIPFSSKDHRLIDQLNYTEQRNSNYHLSPLVDFGSHNTGILGFYPSFTGQVHQARVRGQRDLKSLHQGYFGDVVNDYEGELIDFSMKKENFSKPNSEDEGNGNEMNLEEKKSKKSYNTKQQSEWKNSSNSISVLPDHNRYLMHKKFRNRTNCESSVSMVTESYVEKESKLSDNEGNHGRRVNANGPLENMLKEIKTEPLEPVNLKIEVEEKVSEPIVKLEPGTETMSTIERMLSDSSVPNFTGQGQSKAESQGQDHSPTSQGTMHLNFSCKICGQNFKNRQYRDFHVKLHASSHLYYCNLCSAGFDNEADCKKHQSEHTEPVFQCESCGYRCTREFRMRAHKEICGSPSKIFKCPFCHKQFAAQRYMRIHIKSHDVHNIHTCPVCQNTYPLKNSLLKHMKKKHGQATCL